MTHKDHEAIALVLNQERPMMVDYSVADPWQRGAYDEWGTIVLRFAGMLAKNNPRFDRARFLRACECETSRVAMEYETD